MSSRTSAELALKIGSGIIDETCLNNEYVHFDAKRNQCSTMKTITLCVYHSVMRKMCLATMLSEKENIPCLKQFWNLFLEMLRDFFVERNCYVAVILTPRRSSVNC